MMKKTFALAALAGAALISAAPAFADGYRHGNGHGQDRRVMAVQQPAPHYAQRRWIGYRAPAYRPVVVQRAVYVRPAPAVVYRQHGSNDVLGGLILGAMLGAVIANHAGY
ncbi:MAG: hypothetical protein OEO84_09700 [Betaproteobacteria bacterium]|nr:hypothetical protein [Betaproteobacteria bacterium]